MEIRTLFVVLCFVILLEVIALSALFRTVRRHSGQGSWVLGLIILALALTPGALGQSPLLRSLTAVVSPLGAVVAMFLFRHGLLRFLGRSQRYLPIVISLVAFLGFLIWSTLVQDDIVLRRWVFSALVSSLSLWTAGEILVLALKEFQGPALFLAATFLANAAFFGYRATTTVPLSEVTSLVALSMTVLWTSGFILLLGQRMLSDNRQANEQQEAVFQTIPDAVLLSRLSDGLFIRINRGFLDLTGYERAEVIGKTSLEVNVWADPLGRQRFVALLTKDGECQDFPTMFRRKSGETFPALVSSRLLPLEGVPHILSVVRDLSERERAEWALRESEQRYRLLADHSNDVIWTLSLDGKFTYVSPSVHTLLGNTPEQMLDRPVEEAVSPGSRAALQEGLRRVYHEIETGEKQPAHYFELELPRSDGTTIWTEATARPMYNLEKAVGVVGVSRDITERRALENELYLKATTDSLTGAVNRRRFLELATMEVKRAKRRHGTMTVALLDVDHFKQINDNWGHAAGDEALVTVTRVCRRNVRDIDVFARFGGDEFVLLFPDTTQEQSRVVLDRIQKELARERSPLAVSLGVTGLTADTAGLDGLLERADQMLYRAKVEGRNRIVLDPEAD